MLVRSNFFPQFVKKIERLKLSLSKQRNKMLKIRFESLKIRKSDKIIEIGKTPRENVPGISRIPKIFGIASRKIFLKFSVFREVENPGKGETLFMVNKREEWVLFY